MMRALNSGLLGVKSHQSKMDVVGNNISNVNTTGYKSSRTTFADILSQNIKGASASAGEIGSTNPIQIGLGAQVASIDTIFRDGAPMVTGKNTDLCLSGDGLFVVRRGNETYYTRDGAFEFDAAGNYVLPGSGHFVQGWMANNGVIDTTGAVSDIKIQQVMAAQPTTKIDFQYNLDANTPLVKEMSGGMLYETVQKVKKTETIWEEVDIVGVLEEEESLYNLKVKIGDNDYILHGIGDERNHEEDIDLSKNWKVTEVGAYTNWEWPITLEDDDKNTSTIRVIPKDSNDIKVGDSFSADTSYLRFKSTVNEVSPLDFSVNGINYKAVGMGHSVEIPGDDWYVASSGVNGLSIEQRPNGIPNGCSVSITLDGTLSADEVPPVGGKLEFAGDAYTATRKRPVTITTEEDVVTVTNGTYKYYNSAPIATTVNIYDSLGRSYQLPVYFVREGASKDGTAQSTGKWLVSLENNAAVKKGEITTYEFTDADGKKASVTMPAAEIQFDSSGKLVTDGESDITGNMVINFASGSTAQNVTLDFAKLTQYFDDTSVTSNSNGNLEGTLKETWIDNSGVITGAYTNGETRAEAQVALAHFDNSAGLLKTGTSLYQESANSGNPITIKAGEFGTVITPGALEMSNVDVANEFADMIITQRGFQSNAKIITVGNEMIETAVNMKR